MSTLPAVLQGMNNQIGKASDEDFDKLASGKYLPRIQLMSSNSKLVQSEQAKGGEYLVIKSKTVFNSLTKNFDGLVLAWRPKALKIDAKDGITTCYQQAHPTFQKIQDSADAPGAFQRGDSVGPEFLIWVPKLAALATFFCNSKTARRESGNLMTILKAFKAEGKIPAASFKSSLKSNAQYTWWGPDITACSSPISPMPEDAKLLDEEVKKFLNPPALETETMEEAEKGGRTL